MKSQCDAVAERVALGEAIGDLGTHVSGCERCRAVIDMPSKLGATRRDVDPGLGFAARMTMGAQHRIAIRRRRRVAAGLAATVTAGTFGVFVMTRVPEQPSSQISAEAPQMIDEAPVPLADEDLAALVRYSDTTSTIKLSADWKRIQRPLSPYARLIKGVTQ